MTLWCGMTQEQGQLFANLISQYRPCIGTLVRVDQSKRTPKKHIGKLGVVFWHGIDQFDNVTWRWADANGRAMREVRGRNGYRVGIRLDNGEKIFAGADDVMIEVAS